jgi:hypothetical protein
LAALNLLAQYEPQSGVWEKHLKALDEYKALVAMYLKSTRSWLSRARHWAEFLQILENSRKRNQLEPASDSDYWRQVEGRSTILQEAKGLARKGEHHAALKLLAPLIPAARPDWILLEHLESVDLAITCAQRIGEVERVEEWLGSLRNLARGYIRQSIESITDPKAHQLAVDLMRELDTAQSAAGAS